MAKKSKSIDEIMAEEGIVPAAIPKPTMDTTLPNAIKFFWPDSKVTIRAEGIYKDRQGIHTFLTFWTQMNGVIYGPVRLNLQSGSGKIDLLRQLRDREPHSGPSTFSTSSLKRPSTCVTTERPTPLRRIPRSPNRRGWYGLW